MIIHYSTPGHVYSDFYFCPALYWQIGVDHFSTSTTSLLIITLGTSQHSVNHKNFTVCFKIVKYCRFIHIFRGSLNKNNWFFSHSLESAEWFPTIYTHRQTSAGACALDRKCHAHWTGNAVRDASFGQGMWRHIASLHLHTRGADSANGLHSTLSSAAFATFRTRNWKHTSRATDPNVGLPNGHEWGHTESTHRAHTSDILFSPS